MNKINYKDPKNNATNFVFKKKKNQLPMSIV